MEKFRSGPHAVFRGREFRLAALEDGKFELISKVANDISLGFIKYSEGIYTKPVNKSELESIFSVDMMASYHGFEFGIFGQDIDSGTVSLTTGNEKIAERFGFDRADKFYWEKWVPVSELDRVWEVKSALSLQG